MTLLLNLFNVFNHKKALFAVDKTLVVYQHRDKTSIVGFNLNPPKVYLALR